MRFFAQASSTQRCFLTNQCVRCCWGARGGTTLLSMWIFKKNKHSSPVMEQQAPRGWKSPAAQVLHGKCELIETPLFFFFFFFPPPTTRYESHLREDESLCLQQHKLARRQTKKKKTSDQISAENVYLFPAPNKLQFSRCGGCRESSADMNRLKCASRSTVWGCFHRARRWNRASLSAEVSLENCETPCSHLSQK